MRGVGSMAAGDLTQKQEAFCLAYIETGNATEAYRRAYDVDPSSRDSWMHVEACQLLDNPKVSQRVAALQEQAAKLSLFTVKAAFEEYEEARALALKEGNPSAAVSAVTGKVKLFGLDSPRRHVVTGADGGPIKTEETGGAADKLATLLAGIAERSRETGDPAGE